LSDLHFTHKRDVFRFVDLDPPEFVSKIVDPLSVRPDYVVISGDFTWDGDIADFELARPFLQSLIARLELTPDQIAICPGNHDIRWERGDQPASQVDRRSAYQVFYRQLKQRDRFSGRSCWP
jgi:3',5'-cyclic AMP phosphodiesterase CpdA